MNKQKKTDFKKLIYITPRDIRKNRADAVHIMYSCYAFAKIGFEVKLVAPKVSRKDYHIRFDEVFKLYGLPRLFDIIELPTKIDETKEDIFSSLNVVVNKFIYHTKFVIKSLPMINSTNTIIYSKCFISIVPYLILNKINFLTCLIIFESVFFKNTILHRYVLKNSSFIVTGNIKMQKNLNEEFKIPSNKILKVPLRLQIDELFKINLNKHECRNEFDFKMDKKYILYAGKTGDNIKRLEYILSVVKQLKSYTFVIVGANEKFINKYKDRLELENLLLFSFQSYENYNKLVSASDILLAYYEENEYNRHYLGPSKAGSYLISGNPVIFSDLPSLRERFCEDMVYFVKPDDLDAFRATINKILENPEEAERKGQRARNFAVSHTFTSAARYILDEIVKRTKIN